MEDRNSPLVFAQRTRKNLEFIRKALAVNKEVHLVTQLTNSLLGLVIVPRAKYKDHDLWNVTLKDLEKQGWPKWEPILNAQGQPGNLWADTTTLKDLVTHLRNAAAHGHFEFTEKPDSPNPAEVTLVVRDAPGPGNTFNWQAEIRGDSLDCFCKFLTKRIEDYLG